MISVLSLCRLSTRHEDDVFFDDNGTKYISLQTCEVVVLCVVLKLEIAQFPGIARRLLYVHSNTMVIYKWRHRSCNFYESGIWEFSIYNYVYFILNKLVLRYK